MSLMETNTTHGTDGATTTTRLGALITYYREGTPRMCTRHKWNASKLGELGDASFELTLDRTDGGGFRCRWSTNRGAGWTRAIVSTTCATEAAAMAIATRKLARLCAWLADVTPVAGVGIAGVAFTITR